MLRFRPRHVHKTLAAHLESELLDLGWVNSPVNFGTTPITFSEFEPDEPGPTEIKPNTVSITLGDEPGDSLEELGGRLWKAYFPVFVDIYGVNSSVARSIADDVKTVFADLSLTVLDWTSNLAGDTTGEMLFIERESIEVERPPAAADAKDIRKNWRVVKAMAEVTFQD